MYKTEFFIDPLSGQVFTHKDLETYFQRINVPMVNAYYKPLTNKRIIQVLLEEFSKCFDSPGQEYKRNELMELAEMLNEEPAS